MSAARASAAIAALVALSLAVPARAGGVLIVRAKGTQIDEAVGALKAELGDTAEMVADESVTSAEIEQRAAAQKAGVVVAVGARAAQLALKQSAAPVVHCMVLQDAASFDGDHSAGVPLALPAKAQLQALLRVAPSAKQVGLLYDPKLNGRVVDDATAAARALGLTIVARPVATATAAPAALDDVADKVNALLIIPDATVVTKELVTFLVARAFEKKLPVLAFSESLAKLGVLAALAPSYAQNGKLCAALAKRVLAGEKPADLHGAVQMSGTMVVNVSTARRLGITIAPDVLKPPTELVGQ